MRKIVGRVGALMRRRKPGAGEEAAPVPGLPEGQGALPVSGEPSHQERSEDPAPAPGQAVAGPASGPEAVPVPARQERPHRAAPDLVFMLSGQPGQPGIDLSCVHADTGYRLRESHPEALYPDEVEGGDYILDVTGHALSFGPQGRPGAHVFVPVKTHKGSPSSMPRNAAGNALVPIEARIVERIDRETAAVKVRLQRPVVAWVSLRGGADAAVQEAAVADEPKVEALEIEPAGLPAAAPGHEDRFAKRDAASGRPGDTDAERRAQDELSSMGFLLAHQAVATQGALAAAGDGQGDPAPEGKEGEWSPEGAYGR